MSEDAPGLKHPVDYAAIKLLLEQVSTDLELGMPWNFPGRAGVAIYTIGLGLSTSDPFRQPADGTSADWNRRRKAQRALYNLANSSGGPPCAARFLLGFRQCEASSNHLDAGRAQDHPVASQLALHGSTTGADLSCR